MNRVERIRTAIGRSTARADTIVGLLALWFGGYLAAGASLAGAILSTIVGIVFLTASGDYAWRKGFVAGKRDTGGTSGR